MNKQNQQGIAGKIRKIFGTRRWMLGLVVAGVVAAGVVGALYVNKNRPAAPSLLSPLEQAKKNDQIIQNASQLARNGKPDAANAAYEAAINGTSNPYEKSVFLVSKATLAFNAGKYNDALVVAKQAEAVNKNSAVTSFIAQIYEKLGDNKKAAEYYQNTIGLLNKSDPMVKADTEYYQVKVKELTGTGQ